MKTPSFALSLVLAAAAGACIVETRRGPLPVARTEQSALAPFTTHDHAERIEQTHAEVKSAPRSRTGKVTEDLDTEWALRDFFYSRANANLFELSSVTCSGSDCALRIIAFANGRVPAPGGFDSGPIQTIAYEYSMSELSKTLLPDGLTSNYFEDRTIYTLDFKHAGPE
jgi:hypothetical protein